MLASNAFEPDHFTARRCRVWGRDRGCPGAGGRTRRVFPPSVAQDVPGATPNARILLAVCSRRASRRLRLDVRRRIALCGLSSDARLRRLRAFVVGAPWSALRDLVVSPIDDGAGVALRVVEIVGVRIGTW